MIQVACFDLETTSLNADFGIILCGVIKPAGGDPLVFRADELNKGWDKKRSDDSAVVSAIVSELSRHDILIAHNGLNYDLPFLRTRMAKHGMPPLRSFKLVDPVQVARRALRMSGNSLERIADFLGCNSKTSVDGSLWLQAALDGDRKAMDAICHHCEQDVLMLEKIVDMVKHYAPTFNSKGSMF